MAPKAKKQSTLMGFFSKKPSPAKPQKLASGTTDPEVALAAAKENLSANTNEDKKKTPAALKECSQSSQSPSQPDTQKAKEAATTRKTPTPKQPASRSKAKVLDESSSDDNSDGEGGSRTATATGAEVAKQQRNAHAKKKTTKKASQKKSQQKIAAEAGESSNDSASDDDGDNDDRDDGGNAVGYRRGGVRRSTRLRKKPKLTFNYGSDEDEDESSSAGDDSDSDGYMPDEVDQEIEKEDQSLAKEMAKTAEKEPPSDDDAGAEGSDDDDGNDDIVEATTPKKKAKRASVKRSPSTPRTPTSSSTASSSTATTASGIVLNLTPISVSPSGVGPKQRKEESRYKWLQNPKDKNGKSEGEKGYDPTTLHIPKSAWEKFTPFEKQYWEVKQYHWDSILFFKKGKFYEIYERDAEIGHREFHLKVSDRVNMCMAGVPEATFTDWAARFLAAGHKVAKAEERENAIAKKMRESKSGKKGARIIERKLSAVYTAGTLMGDFVVGDMSNFIMSIKEDPVTRTYGVCFADTATAHFNLCHFVDDPARMALETLVVQTMPKEIVLCKGAYSAETMAILKQTVGKAAFNIRDSSQFWSAAITIDSLEKGGYFPKSETADTFEKWPSGIREYFEKEEAISALGGLISYFKFLLIDQSLLSKGTFTVYDPMNHESALILDGQTLQNLDIIENSSDGSTTGTLFELLCHCHTAFGKRQFRRWLCHPLRKVDHIVARQKAIEDFTRHAELRDAVKSMLKALPDLERLLSRIHVKNCKLSDFLTTLDTLDAVHEGMQQVGQLAGSLSLQSKRLQSLLKIGGRFPDLETSLAELSLAFDRDAAKETGVLAPNPGTDAAYDTVLEDLERIKKALREHLEGIQTRFKSGTRVKYWQPNAGRERYQILVPNQFLKHVPRDWKLMSSTKNCKRYHSPRVAELVQEYLEAEELESQVLRGFFTSALQTFDEHNSVFGAAVAVLSEVDCLLSLYTAKELMSGSHICCPTFVTKEPAQSSADGSTSNDEGQQKQVLDVRQLRHPCLKTVSDFIPNDTILGGEGSYAPQCMLLTGPNMGGKSTLLRQICIAVIMAQMGCWVPAEAFTLSPVDRIFTRIGANDNIIAGRSTFMVELKETAVILKKATPASLVILDELGRGTSTFDGFSIAYSVIKHIAEKIKCRCLFATHYHLLTDEMDRHPNVVNYNMACVVDEHQRDVTFLYQLQRGVCSKSYGMNVAHMAGVMEGVVESAKAHAMQYEATSKFGKLHDRRGKQLALTRFKDDALGLLGDDSLPIEQKRAKLMDMLKVVAPIATQLNQKS